VKTKIGIIAPTYNRPDFARLLALQMKNQTLCTDLIAFHQNGTVDSYEWAVKDIDLPYKWIHTPNQINQEEWYAKPIEALLEVDCTHFFWCDHDDIYISQHIEKGMKLLEEYDHVVNEHSGMLLLKKEYVYQPNKIFTAHDPGGMSSSMCFNRNFAIKLLSDLRNNVELKENRLYYADQVVRRVTMPGFKCLLNKEDATTVYVCHSGTVSSSHWLE